ncbi:MAG: DUF494 domain-containing protein, partial [Pseudomonadota bacterium]
VILTVLWMRDQYLEPLIVEELLTESASAVAH